MLLLMPAPIVCLSAVVTSLPLPLPSLVSQDARVPTIIAAITLPGRHAIRPDISTEPDMSFYVEHHCLIADLQREGRSHVVVQT